MFRIFEKNYTKTPANIGYENTVSLKELVLKICDISKKKIGLNYDLSKPEGKGC